MACAQARQSLPTKHPAANSISDWMSSPVTAGCSSDVEQAWPPHLSSRPSIPFQECSCMTVPAWFTIACTLARFIGFCRIDVDGELHGHRT